MAGRALCLRGTVRHVGRLAMRGQLTVLAIAGAMLTAGLGTPVAASAATTPPLAITTTAFGGGTVSQAFTIAIGTGSLDQVTITAAVYYKDHSPK